MIGKVTSVLVICIIASTFVNGQYSGGASDGFTSWIINPSGMNTQAYYCSGGPFDGFISYPEKASLNKQESYCSGGPRDGFSTTWSIESISDNQPEYCSGGSEDGIAVAAGWVTMVSQIFYCKGGGGDGFHLLSGYMSQNKEQQFYCSGGTDDGFHAFRDFIPVNSGQYYSYGGAGDGYVILKDYLPLNKQQVYCSGFLKDGFTEFLFTGQSYGLAYFAYGGIKDGYQSTRYYGAVYPGKLAGGGRADGFSPTLFAGFMDYPIFVRGGEGDGASRLSLSMHLGAGIWKGTRSSDWLTAANWQNNIRPVLQTRVVIPPGCIYYPFLQESLSIGSPLYALRCSQMNLLLGGQLISNSGIFVNGKLTIQGIMLITHFAEEGIYVSDQGSVEVEDGGVLIIEK